MTQSPVCHYLRAAVTQTHTLKTSLQRVRSGVCECVHASSQCHLLIKTLL
jgi:hypothetical protein